MDIFSQLGGYFNPQTSKLDKINASNKKQFIATSERLINGNLNLSSGDIYEMLFALSQNNNMDLPAELVEEYTEKICREGYTIDGCIEAFNEIFETELV